jgi:5-carboxyvanillate decarboxylase
MSVTRRQLLGAVLPGTMTLLAAGSLAAPVRPSLRATSSEPASIIDLHSHWFSPSSVAALSAREFGPRISIGKNGEKALHRPGAGQASPPFPLGSQWFDMEQRLAHLAEVGIVHQMLSWPTTLGVDPALGAADTLPIWKAYNDELSATVRKWPKQFSGVAALSTSDIDWSVRELARAHGDLGLIGPCCR